MTVQPLRRPKPLPSICILLLGTAVCAAPLLADNHELPGADEIIARHVEAIGGEDAIRAHTSMTRKGTFEIPAMGMSGDMTTYHMAPDKGFVHVSFAGMGENSQGYDGEIGWIEDPMQGPRLLEGAELNALKRQLRAHADLEYSEHYPERKTVGEGEWSGQPAYQVALVDADGNESSRYFSIETGLLLGEEGSTTNNMGTTETKTTWTDYKEFGGVRFAGSVTLSLVSVGMEFTQTVESVTFDDVDPSVFEPSDAIKALLPE